MIRCILKYLGVGMLIFALAVIPYAGIAYFDALAEASQLQGRANALIADGKGAEDLGDGRRQILLAVEDPGFEGHSGIDLASPGAGATTITQSLAKRLAFEEFTPGIGKIRQTAYAYGLERELTKDQILALWLDTLEMGQGPQGWMTGFHNASEAIFARAPKDLTQEEFLTLVAVLIAPASFDLRKSDPALQGRVARIEKLIAGACQPDGNGDVWLEACR
ncbi:MAG: transglycosylase domain-containing protein [Pseudorhodobacter sp.]